MSNRMPRWFSKVGKLTKDYALLPDSYIKRAMEQVEWRNPRGKPQYMHRVIEKTKFHFGRHRPWTEEFRRENMFGAKNKKPVLVEPILEWSFFRGDRVEVLVGKDKGKQGLVNQIIQERNWVFVEGLNAYPKYMGRTPNFPGIIVQTEAPLLVTHQVALVDPSDLKPTRVEWRYTEQGEKVRVSVRTGRILTIPKAQEETYAYKTRVSYKESDKDTVSEDVSKITFKPELKTFEMDIMEKMNIKEDRIPVRSYWY